jgi:hypothetical protein
VWPRSRRFIGAGGQADQSRPDVVQQTPPVAIDHPASGDEYIVMAGRAVKRQQLPRRFAHPALGAIALDGSADLAGRRKADADTGRLVGPAQHLDRNAAARQRAPLGAGQELPTFLQPIDASVRFPQTWGYGLTNLWRWMRARIGSGRRRFRR